MWLISCTPSFSRYVKLCDPNFKLGMEARVGPGDVIESYGAWRYGCTGYSISSTFLVGSASYAEPWIFTGLSGAAVRLKLGLDSV